MGTVYFLCGLPTAGKTTLAKRLAAEQNAVRLTLDERMIGKYDYTIFDAEYGRLAAQEKEAMWAEAQQHLAHGRAVVLDWSLWSRTARAEWTQKATAAGYPSRLFYLDVPLETLKARLAARNQTAGPSVHVIPVDELVRFSRIFEPPTAEEQLDLVVVQTDEDE